MQTSVLCLAILVAGAHAQSDGNPHNWDRSRRCDHTDYDPPCGTCEGFGGIPTGDDNDAITLTSCEVVANATDVDAATLIKPVWRQKWHVDPYFEVLIGKKLDPFCFSVIPGNDSRNELCYRADYGSQSYDLSAGGAGALRHQAAADALREQLEQERRKAARLEKLVGKLASEVRQGKVGSATPAERQARAGFAQLAAHLEAQMHGATVRVSALQGTLRASLEAATERLAATASAEAANDARRVPELEESVRRLEEALWAAEDGARQAPPPEPAMMPTMPQQPLSVA